MDDGRRTAVAIVRRPSPVARRPQTMRLCFVCNEYPPGPHGGIGSMTQVLARALVRAGHQVRVVGMYPADYPAPDYEEDRGVRVWRLRQPAYRLAWIPARIRLFRMVRKWGRRGAIDLVEVPDWEGWAAGWPRLRVPVVVRLNGSASYFTAEVGQSVERSLFWLERASLRRADFWCSSSQYTAEKTKRLFRLPTGPDAVLYNPVEVPLATQTERSRHKVVFTGTLTAKKGVISLIDAWPRVVKTRPDAELHVYGKDGLTDDGNSVQAYLRSRLDGQLAGSVRFHNHVPRQCLLEELQSARAAAFPSYAEAFALAPLEAMACGCPTVYSSRGSGPELIRHGQDGLLVDPDRPDQISEAITTLLEDDSLAQQLGDAGRRRVQECFSVEALLPKNEAFYVKCIGDFHKRRNDQKARKHPR